MLSAELVTKKTRSETGDNDKFSYWWSTLGQVLNKTRYDPSLIYKTVKLGGNLVYVLSWKKKKQTVLWKKYLETFLLKFSLNKNKTCKIYCVMCEKNLGLRFTKL